MASGSQLTRCARDMVAERIRWASRLRVFDMQTDMSAYVADIAWDTPLLDDTFSPESANAAERWRRRAYAARVRINRDHAMRDDDEIATVPPYVRSDGVIAAPVDFSSTTMFIFNVGWGASEYVMHANLCAVDTDYIDVFAKGKSPVIVAVEKMLADSAEEWFVHPNGRRPLVHPCSAHGMVRYAFATERGNLPCSESLGNGVVDVVVGNRYMGRMRTRDLRWINGVHLANTVSGQLSERIECDIIAEPAAKIIRHNAVYPMGYAMVQEVVRAIRFPAGTVISPRVSVN